ncbi:hypothetical protein O3P69_009734, partial [Scylla paramamosain]
ISLVCYIASGHVSVFSLSSLRQLIYIDFLPLVNLRNGGAPEEPTQTSVVDPAMGEETSGGPCEVTPRCLSGSPPQRQHYHQQERTSTSSSSSWPQHRAQSKQVVTQRVACHTPPMPPPLQSAAAKLPKHKSVHASGT